MPQSPAYVPAMGNDAHIAEEIRTLLAKHLRQMRLEARDLIAQLETVDRERAEAELVAAIDSYGSDMISDALYWLQRQTDEDTIAQWRDDRAAEAKRVPQG
jgi:hypothetical protein